MRETQWTKGPWEVKAGNHPNGEGEDRVISAGETVICGWWNWRENYKLREANAHLMSAAPDMAEALEPFAAFASLLDEKVSDDTPFYIIDKLKGSKTITHGDFRRALAALSKATNGNTGEMDE